MARILLVDDEAALIKGLKYSLEREGFDVYTAENGKRALQVVEEVQPDLVVLDLMLPELDGTEVCKSIRKHSTVPIIMLTARNEDIDKILGLEIGADDYMTKPFSTRELIARIRANLRRVVWGGIVPENESIAVGALHIDLVKRLVHLDGELLDLTAKEYNILLVFATNPGRVFTRENLLELVWGYEYYGDVRNVDVHVRRLREKIEKNPSCPEYVLTRWGVGYNFRER
ncbi:MAG: response regulator transcription factor [Firmicutes bacterium]|nr:response regulator transcription factor [Dethiobacter sp.]MBS3887960.1 response regulator transcription factor [Bacillota bacterium]